MWVTQPPSAAHRAAPGGPAVIDLDGLQRLLDVLSRRGHRVIGPTVRDGAIVYDEIASVEQLPAGWTEEQGPGTYRLKRRQDRALFGYAVGPRSFKQWLYPPSLRLWQAVRRNGNVTFVEDAEPVPRFAFIGARACELHAIAIQDRVFLGGPYQEPSYRARRDQVFIVAVQCTQPSGTCFCASMGTGPRADSGFDLALTELPAGEKSRFLVEVGSQAGAEVLEQIPHRPPSGGEAEQAAQLVAQAARRMGRVLETEGLREALYANLEHPRWDAVAARCLSCANCTMVCPTCFCATVEDVTDLSGETAERWRRWDSCFTLAFSYIHGGTVRSSARSRYRQWMTHKLATWVDQFGTFGCVGCGRCITWCPVGIDITEEAQAIRETVAGGSNGAGGGSAGDGKPGSAAEGAPVSAGSG